MAEEKNIIDELLENGFTKREIHSSLHKAVMQQIKNGDKDILKQGLTNKVVDEARHNNVTNKYPEKHISQEMLILKRVQKVQHDPRQEMLNSKNASDKPILEDVIYKGQEILKQVQDDAPHNDHITPKKNHPNPVVKFLKRIDTGKRISGKALSLLKSQFAKKPKNPV